MRLGLKAGGIAALCCWAAACSSNTTVGTKYAKTQLVQALQGGTVTVTAADDPTLAATALQIPPDALAADTTITVAEADTWSQSLGPVADFGPAGTAFTHPVTITMPFRLQSGQTAADLAIQGIDAAGNVVSVPNGDLQIDATTGTVSFIVASLVRFGPVANSGAVCPPGETLCGCCGGGQCVPAGQPCAANCPANACPVDGGSHGGGCCPAGEQFCGCGSTGQCVPAGQPCIANCPAEPPNAVGPDPVCCPPGEYLCGCGGEGICIPDSQACPLLCPVCDPPNTVPSPCGCIPPGAICDCDPTRPSTVPCQCDPRATAAGPICRVDGGPLCPPPDVMTPCGCLPPGASCVPPPPPDGGVVCANPTELRCCDGLCVSAGQACPTICLADGGSVRVDGGVCPSSAARCPNGTCATAGSPCP